jgi:uncharacterized protein (TIGR02145 family)
MKATRIFLLLSVLAAVSYSCTVRQLDEAVEPLPGDTVLSFTATLGDEAQTRSLLGNNYSFLWSPGEQVNLFYGNSGNTPGSLFVSENLEPAASAVFSGNIHAFTGGGEGSTQLSFWGVTPYFQSNRCNGSSVQVTLPTVQEAAEENFANNTMLLVANSPGLALSFFHVGTFLRVCVTNPNISSITFMGNNGEIVGGRVSVTMDANGKPVWSPIEGEGSTSVRLERPNCFTPGDYYLLTFLPQTFQNGWSLVFEKSDGTVGKYTKTGSATFVRASSKNASNRDVDLTYIPMYVEMGPDIVWGTMNLGASSPEEVGDYLAWGETAPKASYGWNNYRFGSQNALTKYVTDNAYGSVVDHRTALLPEDDAASLRLGQGWRIPTSQEWMWLSNNCTWTETTQNGVAGYLVTSKVSGYAGNSIFLPKGGYYSSNSILHAGEYGYYWSSTLQSDNSNYAQNCDYGVMSEPRYEGQPVRPVRMPRVLPGSMELAEEAITVGMDLSHNLSVSFQPSNTTDQSVVWTSANPAIATVNGYGVVTGVSPGTTQIVATALDSSLPSVSCTVTVIQSYVDMGGGYEWALYNVGANAPEEAGQYFAWAETTSRNIAQRPFDWNHYMFGREGNLYAYNDRDGLVTLQSRYDAASTWWKGRWRTPTLEDWQWLKAHSTSAVVTVNGVRGRRITSSITGNSIFLPFSGTFIGSDVEGAGNYGRFWSSSLASDKNYAYAAEVDANAFQTGSSVLRPYGLPIRAVRHQAVDLGNGVKWATANLGAADETDAGDYFAWGELSPKDMYTWNTYLWGTNTALTRYITDPDYAAPSASVDNLQRLSLRDDAASDSWGQAWRMPTKDDWTWLLNNCTLTWTDNYSGTGVAGCVFQSTVNGKQIFFPTTGFKAGPVLTVTNMGFYWSSSLVVDDPSIAWCLATTSNLSMTMVTSEQRMMGLAVRPVSDK